jgi:phosphoglycolate phosphatase-like HAD superfamily hydrolase
MGSLKCVTFDFDGVLVESNRIKRDAYFQVFASMGPEGSPLVARAVGRRGERNRYDVMREIVHSARAARILDTTLTEDELVARYAMRYNEICEVYVATCPEVPGTRDALPRLASRYALYVNSSTPDEPLSRIVRDRGWASYFQGVYGSARRKADNLAEALRREGTKPEEAAFIGDTEVDRTAARGAGWHFIGMSNDYNDFEETPSCLCSNLAEVEAAISEL